MRKPKIYLDTSIISYLYQLDTPDKMNDTLLLWEEIKQGYYEVYISQITVDEILENSEPKLSILIEYMSQIEYTILVIDDDVREFADRLNEEGTLSKNHYDDCLHIGCAVVNYCNMILSWNFTHIVRVKTINGVRYISSSLNYNEIGIYSPSMIIDRS